MTAIVKFIVAFFAYFIPYSAFTMGGASTTDFNTGFACVLLILIAMILNDKK